MRLLPSRISKSHRPSKFMTVSVTRRAPTLASAPPLLLAPEPLELELDELDEEPEDEGVASGAHPESAVPLALLLLLAPEPLELELDMPDAEDVASGAPSESAVPFPMIAPPHPAHAVNTAPIPTAAARCWSVPTLWSLPCRGWRVTESAGRSRGVPEDVEFYVAMLGDRLPDAAVS